MQYLRHFLVQKVLYEYQYLDLICSSKKIDKADERSVQAVRYWLPEGLRYTEQLKWGESWLK